MGTTILSALTNLYTKCWLITHGRFSDLINFAQTNNTTFTEEANLIIAKLTHNSPVDIKFEVSAEGIAKALQIAIDAPLLAPQRKKAAALDNQARELEIKQKALEAQAASKREEQSLQIEAQQAELERQKALLEIERQQVEIEKVRVSFQKQLLELEAQRISFALETASKMVDILYQGIDAQTKAMVLQTLIPNLLQLANGKGLELALPVPKDDDVTKGIKEV